MSKPLVLIDGSSYLYRAFHALPPLVSSKGQPTGAIYGVANMVKRLIKDYAAEEVVAVFDAKGKTFRDDLYPEYKANRPPTPVDLSSQFSPLIDVLTALGLPILIIPGVEADDVIGTIANSAKNTQREVIVSTGDKDMAQLVNSHITLINTMTNKVMDEKGVEEKFGVRPEQIIDYLTLVGDTADNIPGVHKCGPKTAAKWLKEYQTLDNLIAKAEQIGGKIGENLRAAIPNLPLSKQLVTIKTDVALPKEIHEYNLQATDKSKLLKLAEELEFKSWIKELSSSNPEQTPKNIEAEIITNEAQLDKWLERIQNSEILCIDTETTSLNALSAELVGVALCVDAAQPAYIPVAHTENLPQLDRDFVLTKLKPLLENPDIKKVGQNLKYDYQVFKNYGLSMQGIKADTMLESYLLNSTGQRHDLDTMALKYLQHNTIKYSEVTNINGKAVNFADVPIAKAAVYAAEDAAITLKLHNELNAKLAPELQKILQDIEIPILSILANMERHGVLVNLTKLKQHGARLEKEIESLTNRAYDLVGREFNLSSPKQLREIFYIELKLPVLAKTPTGQASTSEPVLTELAEDYELPAIILKHRTLSKLLSTYIVALQKKAGTDCRVHTSYNQAVTATGRLSSSDPNLQNIPVRDAEGRLIRQAFIAPPGHIILAADYSQIELRIMAHFSQDAALLNAFANGLDIHQATASEILNIPLDEVTTEQRRRAKAVNFGLIYGMSAFGLAKQLGVERQEAQKYIDTYFNRYPGVLNYMDNTRQVAREKGYVETLIGRRLYLPEINVSNGLRRKAAERAAINAPLQGTAADIIKQAMIEFNNWQKISAESKGITMIMQVHDELVFEVTEDKIDFAKKQVKKLMENIQGLSVPLIVDVDTGENWDAAKG